MNARSGLCNCSNHHFFPDFSEESFFFGPRSHLILPIVGAGPLSGSDHVSGTMSTKRPPTHRIVEIDIGISSIEAKHKLSDGNDVRSVDTLHAVGLTPAFESAVMLIDVLFC